MLDSIDTVRATHGELLYAIEWFFTLIFTLEYLMRLICVGRPLKYATSFFGVVDLLAIIPTYVSLLLPAANISWSSASSAYCAYFASSNSYSTWKPPR